MLPRLSSFAAPPPPHRPPTITPQAYVMTRSGADRRGRHTRQLRDATARGNQRGRQLVNLLRLLPSSRQPSASSFKPSSRQRSTVSRQPPAPHQSDENAPPSPPNRSADFSPVRREASGHRHRSPSPHCRSSARGSLKTRHPPP